MGDAPGINDILAVMDAHAARNLELARATLEAAAAQAATLEEQKKQTRLLEQKEALERGQFLKVSELSLMVASQQELLANINQRLATVEQMQSLALEFIKAALESQVQLGKRARGRLTTAVLRRSKESIQGELKIHYASLAVAKEKAARFGMNVPTETANEVRFLEDEIAQLEQELERYD